MRWPKNKFTFYHQLQSTDCAAACLAMILSYHGKKKYSFTFVKSLFEFTRVGVSVDDVVAASSKAGLKSTPVQITISDLKEIPLPVILFWKQDHFIVLENIEEKNNQNTYFLADPAYGRIKLDEEGFSNEWRGTGDKGILIYSEKDPEWEATKLPTDQPESFSKSEFFREAVNYVKSRKGGYLLAIFLIIIGLLINSSIPFVFKNIIDEGILQKNSNLILFLLASQLVLFISSFISDFFSNLLLTKINFNLSISLKSNLLKKLMNLPIRYFDTRLNTETLQRINDQQKIQNYVTWKGVDFLISILNILLFGSILFYFSRWVFIVYLVLSVMSVAWIFLFLKKRAVLEYALFLRQSENSNHIYEFIMNMPEIKVNNAQTFSINKILAIQKKLNSIELNSLFLNMYQLVGVNFLSKLKEITAIGICAILIMDGKMSLGVLMSISYVIGQLSSPINRLVSLVKDTQDAEIASKRIGEIYNEQEENLARTINLTSQVNTLSINNISFKYPGNFNPFVLNDINFKILPNKVTAIVGSSGSGKTTLLKILLAYYPVTSGKILLNGMDLNDVYADQWRKKCGIVLQDGHIFSGTLAENIAFTEEKIEYDKLMEAARIACIDSFIESLPMGYNTKVGNIGIQLSGGQKQRILIARAVYKDPEFLFLDEATSALDAENEKQIYNNLQSFFEGRTVVVIAHRLSTVKNADQIIVLKHGKIAEIGNHYKLVDTKNEYFNLVRNQLELGN
ncbi:peptidase domain-containing ABC transporter [Chryseobacterium oranimense]|uniref:peptidase domain-containing ABC transporter n=1 Tax=Chryseobacterium oranimense TaxID=421058 RepID=UPI0021AE67F2|nr:peptidase domain-containing ABC transporter [Chryseobacterium oranimense]UWX61964.1 peptidase domain-containing ABC transporter [Chryseobacterium oranimense]